MSPPVRVSCQSYQLGPGRTLQLRLCQFPAGSMLMWIGSERPGRGVLDSLSLAIGETTSTIIDNGDLTCQAIARKISTKYNNGQPVYVSMSVEPEAGNSLLLPVMGHVNEFLRRECGADRLAS